MTTLRKLVREITERVELMLEENDKHKRKRKQRHLNNGDSEEVATGIVEIVNND